jgi:hypothetical protein
MKKREIKRAMQDDLEKAIYSAEETKNLESIDGVKSRSFGASSSTCSQDEKAQGGNRITQTSPPDYKELVPSTTFDDLEPLPLEPSIDPIQTIKVAVCATGRRPSSLHSSLISIFRAEAASLHDPSVLPQTAELSEQVSFSHNFEEEESTATDSGDISLNTSQQRKEGNPLDFGGSLLNIFSNYKEESIEDS